jgi:hypothetical protein
MKAAVLIFLLVGGLHADATPTPTMTPTPVAVASPTPPAVPSKYMHEHLGVGRGHWRRLRGAQ